MQIQNLKLSDITPYGANPRLNDAAVDAVARSIERYGFRQPIVVDSEFVIVVGHTRYKAAKKLGLAEVPVHVAADLSPEKAREYRIADNSTNEIAEWDVGLLRAELGEMPEFKAEDYGLSAEKSEMYDVQEEPPPEMKDGDRAPFRQATFTLHDDQFEAVEAAIKKAKQDGHGESAVNENSNGNALAWIAECFNRG